MMLFHVLAIFEFFVFTIALCPNGSTSSISDPNICYIFVKEKFNWFSAEKYCSENGGTLTSIHDMYENMFLSGESGTVFTESTSSSFWIGANNIMSPGKWSWTDNSSFDFTDWDKGQPQNTVCAGGIINNAKWQSWDCFEQKPFVCLIKPPKVTPPPSICPDGWEYFDFTGFCYKIIAKSLTWWDAEMKCVNEGSHLISIHSWREIVYATNLAAPYSPNGCGWESQTWIGMSTQDNNTHFSWTDGTPFDYTDFAPGEPNRPGLEDCSNIWTGQICEGRYPCRQYNFDCNVKNANFICKKLP